MCPPSWGAMPLSWLDRGGGAEANRGGGKSPLLHTSLPRRGRLRLEFYPGRKGRAAGSHRDFCRPPKNIFKNRGLAPELEGGSKEPPCKRLRFVAI